MKTTPLFSSGSPTAQVPTAPSDREPGPGDRGRAGVALPTTEPCYRRMVEAAEEGIWMLDARARTSFVNPKMALLLGYTVEEMQGRALFDFLDDAGRACAKSHLGRRQQGIAEQHEVKFQRRDGSELWAHLVTNSLHDTDGSYLGALALVVDITERRREVAALRATEARFQSLFEHSPHCLWEEDLSGVKQWFDELRASGVKDFKAHFAQHPDDVTACLSKVKVLDVNQAALQHYQAATKTELIEGLERILAPESFAVLTDELVALANGHTLFESEAVDQSLGGQKNHVLLKVLVAPGAEATLSRVYVSLVDITARKQLEEQLRQSQKMDAIGQLAGGIAHDFNNLLTAIQGDIALLRFPDVSGSQSAEALEHLALATERAAGLTRQLLAFSRRQVLQPRQLDINERVVGLATLVKRLLSADITLVLRLHPHPLLVHADASMLDQVLLNLVVNARDAMPRGGQIVIETSENRDRAGAQPGRQVRLCVTDTGSGISPETLPRVFEPFFTTKEPGKGTGLGLSTAFGIVRQHGGTLGVASELGRGTTFTVHLPASDS